MLFTDGLFYVFLAATLVVVNLAVTREQRRFVLILASLIFYLQFPWPFSVLLFLTVVIDYFLGLALENNRKPLWLFLSLFVNFVPLLAFKILSFSRDLSLGNQNLLEDLIVPLGLSFYTFKSASYILDVYRGVTRPCRSFLEYAFFVTYFPALLSGPVSRFSEFEESSVRPGFSPESFQKGFTLIIYGLVKKIAVADFIHELVTPLWSMKETQELSFTWSALLILATYVKLYCDFSGYSDIARGVSYLFNIRLPRNFDFPLLARDPTDFWSRQHITMSAWFRDYVYGPIVRKFRKTPRTAVISGLWVTFALSAVWHGVSFGAFLFFLIQSAYASGYFLMRLNPRIPLNKIRQIIGWPLTQLVAMTSIFCLLAPGKEEISWVFRGLLNPGRGDYSWINAGLVFIVFSFLCIHLLHILLRRRPVFLSHLRPAVLALFLFLSIVLNAKSVNFIYYQF